MNSLGALSLIIIAICPATAAADSWAPWPDQLIASPTGKYYVVMKRTGGPKVYGEWGPVEFIICKGGTESPPIESVQSKIVELGIDEFDAENGSQLYEIKPNAKVNVRNGDMILGRGTLKPLPLMLLVSDAGLGFAGIDVYGYNYAYADIGLEADNAAIIVSSSGKVIQRTRLIDLFTAYELEHFETSAGGMPWLNYRNPGWINDVTKQLVVVSASSKSKPNHHSVRFIDWQTGEVTKGPAQHTGKDIETLRRSNLENKP